LLDGEVLASLDQLDEGDLVFGCAEIDLGLVLTQSEDEFVLAIQGCIEDGEGFGRVVAVGVETDREEVLEYPLGLVVFGELVVCLEEVAFFDVLAEEVEGCHQLVVGVVEVPDLALEELDQLQGGKLHEEVLDSPFLILLADLVLSVGHLCVDVAAQLQQKLNYIHKLVLVLEKLVIAPLFGFEFETSRLVLALPLGVEGESHLLHVLLVIGQCIFSEALEEVEHEVKAIVIDPLEIGFQLTDVALLQLLLHKFHLFQTLAGQFAQAVEDAVPAGGLELEVDASCE
jgi:hypothetical protein